MDIVAGQAVSTSTHFINYLLSLSNSLLSLLIDSKRNKTKISSL